LPIFCSVIKSPNHIKNTDPAVTIVTFLITSKGDSAKITSWDINKFRNLAKGYPAQLAVQPQSKII